jgi:hypothetical protein
MVTMTRRQRLPHAFGGLLLIKVGDVRRDHLPAINRTPTELDLWETPTGETYWLRPGARLEREGYDYMVL